MGFRTRLDYSDNRQIKQFERTVTSLSGGTEFGVPFSALTSGPDLNSISAYTGDTNVISTYSGNTGTTIFSFGYSPMVSGETFISPFTPSNSGITQYIVSTLVPNNTTVIDGNLVVLDYVGIRYDIKPTTMFSGYGPTFTGSAYTSTVEILTANTLDFTGRTIWVDVNGILRTDKLIVNDNPNIGYVLTCVDSEGKVEFLPSSGSSSATTISYWTAGTGLGGIVTVTNKGSGGDAQGMYSVSEGWETYAHGICSHAEGNNTQSSGTSSHSEGYGSLAIGVAAHSEGRGTIALGDYSHAGGYNSQVKSNNSFIHANTGLLTSGATNSVLLGGQNLTGSSANTVYVPYLNINSMSTGSTTHDIGVDNNGNVIEISSDIILKNNIESIENPLSTILQLNGVTFDWKENGIKDIGFIAQEVEEVIPILTSTMYKSELKTVKYKNMTALIVEAIKEMYNDGTYDRRFTSTESIIAEDNNIDLNYNGNHETSIGGGVTVVNGVSDEEDSTILTNNNGLFLIDPGIQSKRIINTNNYTPINSDDEYGQIGETVWDDDYIYIKTNSGWRRSNLESF